MRKGESGRPFKTVQKRQIGFISSRCVTSEADHACQGCAEHISQKTKLLSGQTVKSVKP